MLPLSPRASVSRAGCGTVLRLSHVEEPALCRVRLGIFGTEITMVFTDNPIFSEKLDAELHAENSASRALASHRGVVYALRSDRADCLMGWKCSEGIRRVVKYRWWTLTDKVVQAETTIVYFEYR